MLLDRHPVIVHMKRNIIPGTRNIITLNILYGYLKKRNEHLQYQYLRHIRTNMGILSLTKTRPYKQPEIRMKE